MKRMKKFMKNHKGKIILSGISLMVLTLFPEIASAVTIEQQLDKVGGLATGKLKTYGVAGSSIFGGAYALFKGNMKAAGAIVFIGVVLAFFLGWVDAGMKVS